MNYEGQNHKDRAWNVACEARAIAVNPARPGGASLNPAFGGALDGAVKAIAAGVDPLPVAVKTARLGRYAHH